MEEQTVTFHVPVYPDTDLSYLRKEVSNKVGLTLRSFFPFEGYGFEVDNLRESPKVEALDHRYVLVTVRGTFPKGATSPEIIDALVAATADL